MGRDMRSLSEVHEKRLAKKTQRLGGRKTINSGAFAFDPGDVALKKYLIDAKTVATEQYTQSIDVRWLHKVKEEAFRNGKKDGLIAFDFGRGTKYDFIAGPLNAWTENIEYREIYATLLKKLSEDLKKLAHEPANVVDTLLKMVNEIEDTLDE